MTGPSLRFEIHDSPSADWLRLSLTGELNLASAPMLEDRLARLRATKSPVRLDLSKLEFIDSTGIHLLIRTVGEARMKGWPVQIDPDVAPQVMRLLRLAHLDHFAVSSSN
jgi:anti-anti-sigma factor